MPTEKSNIIRRKIETGAVYAVTSEAGGDMSKCVTAAVGRVITEHFNTKSNVKGASEIAGSFGELIEKNGENRRGFLFQIEGAAECLVLMDPAAIMAAATWAHEGIIPEEPAPATAKISTIDQRLAGMLAAKIIQAILAGDNEDDAAEANEQGVNLAEMGPDASRFILADEMLSAMLFELEISTMDDVSLGTITLLTPDVLIAQQNDEDESVIEKRAARDWANSMAAMVYDAPIDAKAIIATQNIDVRTLSHLKPGQVITLRSASLDTVTLQPANDISGPSLALGAVRSLDGMRTVQVIAVDA